MSSSDWNPDLYARFHDLRLQPAVDLMTRVGALPPGDICDLGCGTGVAGPLLAERFPGRRLIGVDNSPTMLEKAGAQGVYDRLSEADAAQWQPESPLALLYSNAVLHWLPGHPALLPRLVRHLAPGGVLAVQIPHQNHAPSHRLWHDLAAAHFPGRFDTALAPGILEAEEYFDLLAPLGTLALWETEYYQELAATEEGHPVRGFTSSTFARPVLETLSPAEAEALCALYDDAVRHVYPLRAEGTVLFPFRRLFFVLRRPAM
ncbi:methyltransferase domain-containing protein [Pseudodonghicola flavimaris]|uniref:Methyltransferase domain-containing protein n=1 Tax=Pseudodonghicola flavimaris TaxID=3050036 RepID=A0ABT7EXZ0_9RHOB|nr:methyltransferase domain-containing protein [Pseudodonghicola flavimaris]MDK3017144.1 methyltransferase domain-containing protein [Pseudodonghicola flavimaris]